MKKLSLLSSLFACVILIMSHTGCSRSDSGSSEIPQSGSSQDATASEPAESADEQLADRDDTETTNDTEDVGDSIENTELAENKLIETAGYDFTKPVRIKGGGEFVSVESPGYACPTMADVDGDGREDLVVGQFNQGHLKFYKNIAEKHQPPQFAAGEWLMTGDVRATVPGVW